MNQEKYSIDRLLGVLQGADPKLTTQVILTLAEMNDRKAVLGLLAPALAANSDADVRTAAANALRQLTGGVPGKAEAVRLLTDTAKAYFAQRPLIEGVVDGKVELWRWDEAKRQCVSTTVAADDAARAMAARWARDAHRLAPDDQSTVTSPRKASMTLGLEFHAKPDLPPVNVLRIAGGWLASCPRQSWAKKHQHSPGPG